MKIYIAGKITGDKNYKQKFQTVEAELSNMGHKVMNPAVFPEGFEQEEYLHICFAMIDICDAVYFLNDWQNSKGAKLERIYSRDNNKKIFDQKGGISA